MEEKQNLNEIKKLMDDFYYADLEMNNEEYLKKFIKLRDALTTYRDISSLTFLLSLYKEKED